MRIIRHIIALNLICLPGLFSQAAVMNLSTPDVPANVQASGSAIRTDFAIPSTINGYAVIVQECSLGVNLSPQSSGVMMFNIGFDEVWVYEDYRYHEGSLNSHYFPVPTTAWADRQVDVKMVAFQLGGIWGSFRIDNMWLRVFYDLGGDVQAPTGTLLVEDDPAQEDGRFIRLRSSIVDNSGHVADMRWKYDDGAWGAWVPYQALVGLELPALLAAVVHVQFRDETGNTVSYQRTYTPDWIFILPASVNESDGVLPNAGTIHLPAPAGENESFSLSNDCDWLALPASVTVPQGSYSVSFPITVIDDALLNGTRDATVTAVRMSDSTSVSFDIDVLDDDVFFEDDTVTLTASVLNWQSGLAVLTVFENDRDLRLALPASVREGVGTVSALLSIGGPLTNDLTIAVCIEGSATNSVIVPTQVTLPAGLTSIAIPVQVLDNDVLSDPQTLTLRVSSESWAPASATMQILDDDAGTFGFTQREFHNRGSYFAWVTVRRSGNTANPGAVEWSLVPGTATAGVHFQAGGGTLQFMPGETNKHIYIPVRDVVSRTAQVRLTDAGPHGFIDPAAVEARFRTGRRTTLVSGGNSIGVIAAGDLTGDGTDKVVVARSISGGHELRYYPGGGLVGTTSGGSVNALAVGDVNGDGRNDVIVVQYEGAYVFFNNGSSWSKSTLSSTFKIGKTAHAADVDNDGRDEVFTGSFRLLTTKAQRHKAKPP